MANENKNSNDVIDIEDIDQAETHALSDNSSQIRSLQPNQTNDVT